jgi:hypothetical protein
MVEPRTGSEAARHLRGYFRSFGFTDPVILDRLVGRILVEVDPGESVETVLAHARQRVERWFVDVLGPAVAASGAVEAIGRAAFLLSDSARRWPLSFLDSSRMPAEMIEALRRAAPPCIPHAAVAMPEQSLAFAWPLNPARLLLRRPASKASQP